MRWSTTEAIVELLLVGLSATQSSSSTSSAPFVAPTSQPAPDINSTAYDLSQHYCRLWRHSSVLGEGKIYIDGGNVYNPKDGGNFDTTTATGWTKGMHNHLLVLDLSSNFTNQQTDPYSRVLKPGYVPTALIEGSMWYSRATRKVYQLGGWFSSNNGADPGFTKTSDLPPAGIFEFDTVSNRWAPAEPGFTMHGSTGPGKVERPGAASYVDARELNMSFAFEGYVQQRSDPAYGNYTTNSDFKFLAGMLSLDTGSAQAKPVLRNISVPVSLDGDKTPFGPRMNGGLVHVPVGPKGVLVQIGGQTPNEPTPYGVKVQGANGKNRNIDISFVDIYEIETGFWFRQQTFGLPKIPSDRSDICTVVVPAKDKSSFNIYMVGGVENYNTMTAMEEIWVLSLPSFQWVLVHTRQAGLYGHTCHVVGENLIIIGGMQSKPEGGDVQTCANHMPAEIFSLAIHNYTGTFDAAGAQRHPPVPSQVVSAIGGTPSGGATTTKPRILDENYLQFIFDPALPRKPYTPSYTLVEGYAVSETERPTPSSPAGNDTGSGENPGAGSGSGGGNDGAVIGGAVGGVVGGLFLAALIAAFFILRKRKQAAAAPPPPSDEGADQGPYETGYYRQHGSELPAYTDKPAEWPSNTNTPVPIAQMAESMMVVPQATGPAEMSAYNTPQQYHAAMVDHQSQIPMSPSSTPGHVGHLSVSSTGGTSSVQGGGGFEHQQMAAGEADSRAVSGFSPEMAAWRTFQTTHHGQ